jgi:hypothetical protein
MSNDIHLDLRSVGFTAVVNGNEVVCSSKPTARGTYWKTWIPLSHYIENRIAASLVNKYAIGKFNKNGVLIKHKKLGEYIRKKHPEIWEQISAASKKIAASDKETGYE